MTEADDNYQSSIKIYPKVYVGFQGRRAVDEVPLGFLTPYEDNAAGQKRMATVDSWAQGHGRNKTFNSVTLDNVPMIGFKIGRAVRRSGRFSGNSAKVRVEDPRGFELEISIENMLMLMSSNLIEDGELLAECVWGRESGANVLLPLNSEPYQQYLKTVAKKAAVLSLKDVKVGDTIKLLTGEEGVYMGACYPVRYVHDNDTGEHKPEVAAQKRYVLQGDNGFFYGFSSIKVSTIIKAAPQKLTPAEVNAIFAKAAAQDPAAKERFVDNSGSSWKVGKTMTFVADAKDITFDRQEEVMDWEDMLVRGKAAGHAYYNQQPHYQLYAVGKDGKMLQIQWYHHFTIQHHIGKMREYDTGATRSGYFYSRVTQKTDGVHGTPVTLDEDGVTLRRGGVNEHIELPQFDRLVRMRYTVKTADGAEIQSVC